MIYGFLETPVGRLLVARDTAGVRRIHFHGPANRLRHVASQRDARSSAGLTDRLAVRRGGPPKLYAKAEAGPYLRAEAGPSIPAGWERHDAAFRDVATQLREYFDGSRRAFELQLAPEGTPFQLQVWNALGDIPYGETISYGQLASRVGDPSAARAVGLANGSNPLPIVIPCHRVIGANGKLTGYGGGLAIKDRLLALERGERRLMG